MAKQSFQNNIYDYETLQAERAYHITWYSVLWHILRPVMIGLCAVLIVAGLGLQLYHQGKDAFFSPVDINDTQLYSFTVESGSSLNKISNHLEEAGFIKNHTVFKYYCDFAGMGQKMQVGEYELSKSMDMFEIASILSSGSGQSATINITVIPGMTVEAVADALVKQGILKDNEAFLEICRTGEELKGNDLVAAVKQTKDVSQRKYVLEGYLAPDTYEIYRNAEPLEIIRKLVEQTNKVMKSEWRDRAEELQMTVDEVLTLASMIEKEAKNSDFTKVSAVFHNRLNKNMALESDPTVHYVTGERRMSLRSEDLQIASPYNTYQRKGLPVGPISNPSQEAIAAALYPDETYRNEGYFYFCSESPDSGKLCFSKTLEEHQKAVEMYKPLWQAYDKERGY